MNVVKQINKLANKAEKYDKIRKIIPRVLKSNRVLRSALYTARNDTELLLKEGAELNSQIEQFMDQYKQLEDRYMTEQENLQVASVTNNRLRKEIIILKDETKRLKDKLESKTRIVTLLVRQNATLRESNQNLTQENTNLTTAVNLNSAQFFSDAIVKPSLNPKYFEYPNKKLMVGINEARAHLNSFFNK